MAGFRKAKAEQASLKIGLYGLPGSGKTFTSLLLAEGLAKTTGKRIAFVDTERGTDFYCQAVAQRRVHPEAFDFDAIYTRSITEVLREVKSLDPNQYGVVIIDSMTHIWEACMAAYSGNTTRQGSIPAHAWGNIKKPYKELMAALLSANMHAIICGRQGNDWDTDDNGQMTKVGVKMKAETETPYEPHILIRMESMFDEKEKKHCIWSYVEKDRTGILMGKIVKDPSFDSVCKPLLHLLGATQAFIQTADDVAHKDNETLAEQARHKEAKSKETARQFKARMDLARDLNELSAIAKELTPAAKKDMVTADVDFLREAFQTRESELKKG
jgi:tRNA uridine 5-carbamoylmethylation protein Kti12